MITLTQPEERLYELVRPAAEGLGLDVVRLRLMGGRRQTLQIMIEREDGGLATIDQCADLSRAISPLLDVHDPLPDAYHLEVSTPGIDRPLTRFKDFQRWVGHLVKLELKTPIEGRRRFRGVVMPSEAQTLRFDIDDELELACQLHELSRADLVLTDALIAAAQTSGAMPPQPDADALSGFEVEEDKDYHNETDETDDSDSFAHIHQEQ